MKRTIDQALADLKTYLDALPTAGARAGVRIFVYPPEWEAAMLLRLSDLAGAYAKAGRPLHVVDVGQGLLAELESRKGLIDQLTAMEKDRPQRVLHDLGQLSRRFLTRLLATPLDPGQIARLLVNTGALGTFVSYSGLANALNEDALAGAEGHIAAPTVLAFPGADDARSLNLLRLRADTNYRVPRI